MRVRASSLLIVAAVAMCSTLSVPVASQAAPQQPAGQPAAPLPGAATQVPQARYVGSTTCRTCHGAIYERWSKTRMVNVVTDPKQHWPVGFHQGGSLKDFWKLEEHKLGDTTFTHFADATGHKNRMQGNDFVPTTPTSSNR